MSKTVDSAVLGMGKFWKNGAPKTNLLTRFVDPKNKLPKKVMKNRPIPKNQAVFKSECRDLNPRPLGPELRF